MRKHKSETRFLSYFNISLELFIDNKYPYKPAKLVHYNRDLSKRWHANCSVWDIELNKLVPRKYYAQINRYQTIGERMEAGKLLVDYINDKLEKGYVADHQLLLFIQFIYYTLARPNEIKRMKISDIELDNDQIFIPRENSKNNKSDYVDLYPPLKRAILESKIMDYPKEYYIFSSLRTPGTKISYRKYFWRKHFKILEALKLSESNREYTLYSYKHSGAINLYLSGLEPIDNQKQCRHQTLQQTMDYLRELDLFRKTDHFDKVKGF